MIREPISLSQTVIFDYGEVISVTPTEADQRVISDLAGVTGEAADKFWSSYWGWRHDLDRGLPVRAFWEAIARDIGARWDDARVHELWAADFRSWLSINPGTIEVLADLKAGGTRLALLSNAGADFGSYLRFGPLRDYFETFFISGELELVKPDPEIFTHALSVLGVSAGQAVFVDNREDNVRSAQDLGITGHVFTSAAQLRTFLENTALVTLR